MDCKRIYPEDLKDILLQFSVSCLSKRPNNIVKYAVNYFENLQLQKNRVQEIHKVDVTPESAVEISSTQTFASSENPLSVYPNRREPILPRPDIRQTTSIASNTHKTDEEKSALCDASKQFVIFDCLDEEMQNNIIDAMSCQYVQKDEFMCHQEEDAHTFYLITKGDFVAMHDGIVAKTYHDSGGFGGLALLYAHPYQYSLQALTPGKLWTIDRNTFRQIILQGQQHKRYHYEELLDTLDVFKALNGNRKTSLSDAIIIKYFENSEKLFDEGDLSDGMYFILEGSVSLFKRQPNGDSIRVIGFGSGQHTGEIGLVTRGLRPFTAYANERTRLAFLDIYKFQALLARFKRKAIHYPQPHVTLCENSTAMQKLYKTDAQKTFLLNAFKNYMLFEYLDDKIINSLIDVMPSKTVQADEFVCREGEAGDSFQIIAEGDFELVREGTVLKTYHGQGGFGEILLLHTQPDPYTVRAITPGLLWTLDRDTFRNIVFQEEHRKKLEYENLLDSCDIFNLIDNDKKTGLIDALVSRNFKPGERVYEEGEKCNGIYFIQDGSVSVFKRQDNGNEEKVYELKKGQNFGAIGFTTNGCRTATVYANEDLKVAFLSVFNRLVEVETTQIQG